MHATLHTIQCIEYTPHIAYAVRITHIKLIEGYF